MSANIPRIAKQDVAALSPSEEIIEELRNGRMVILVDAEDRENEGDLVIGAQMCTPEAINFMARYGRGLICLALTRERAEQLDLDLMSPRNQSRHHTNFTVSIEAREGISTGISAHDRARTVAVAIDQSKGATDIVSPGHVFPLVARDGGVLVRTGHTEAAVDLARLAGLYPAGVICEVMNDDGTMARLPDLISFAQFHNLKVGTIADLIAYRRRHDHLLERASEMDIETEGAGTFRLIAYRNVLEKTEQLALVKGDLSGSEPVLVRMHAANVFDDLVGAGAPGRSGQLQAAMREIDRVGRGVVVILRDTRDDAITAWMEARKEGGSDAPRMLREYGVGAQVLVDLGIRDMILLSNSQAQSLVALEGYDLRVVGRKPIPMD